MAAALVAVADVPWNQAADAKALVVLLQLQAADVPLQLPLHAVADVLTNQAADAKAPDVLLQLQAADVLRPLLLVQLQQLPAVADAPDVAAAVDFCRESVTARVAVAADVAQAAVADVLLQHHANHPADVRKPLV